MYLLLTDANRAKVGQNTTERNVGVRNVRGI
jgi:hypothetical protein